MISPEEKIDSPQIKTPPIAKDDVPKRFAYPEPKILGPRCQFLKRFLIGCVGVITIFAIMVTVSLYGELSKSHSLFFSMPSPFSKNVKTYMILSMVSSVIFYKRGCALETFKIGMVQSFYFI